MAETIAFVTPRYGLEFVGGAEAIVRELAEALQRSGVPVEVLTTCSDDVSVWNNAYPAGRVEVNDVPVRRFRTDIGDVETHRRLGEKVLGSSDRVPYHEQQRFIRTSLNSQELYAYLHEHGEHYRCCILAPYLFGTTYHAAQIMRDKAIHIPCLHDERFAYMDIFREMLEEARGILFNAPEEEALARRLGITNPFAAVVGSGFDQPRAGDPKRFHAQHHLDDAPFLLYSGRYEETKNVPLLLEYFRRYKQEHPAPLRLALAGRGTVPIPEDPDVVDLGFFRPGTMADVLASALALVQLSVAESFSLVIMEAWLQGRPVMVHGDCAVTRGHVLRSGGGWPVRTYAEFAAAVDQMLGDRAVADGRGAAGRQYVLAEYSWPAVLRKFHAAIDAFMAPRSLYQTLAQRGRRRALDFTDERYEDKLHALVDKATGSAGTKDLADAQLSQLASLANIGMPEYRVTSRLPLVGRLISWGRVQLTSHLREPYLDPIVQRQERFNRAVQMQIGQLVRLFWQQNRNEDRVKLRQQQARIVELEARLARLEAQVGLQTQEPEHRDRV